MVKKIFDISPPEELGKKKVKGLPLEKRPEFKLSPPGIRLQKKLIFIPLVLIVAGAAFYFTLSRAEIEIWPETEVKTFETKLTVDKRVENINFLANLIPGISFEEEKTFSQEFPSSGKKLIEKKAEGVIRVYNNQTAEQILIPSRFRPPLDKFLEPLNEKEEEYPWFWSQERIVIPSKGYKDVKVVAAASGEKYNIKPTKFVLPAFRGSSQYTLVYGESFTEFKGGLKKDVSEVIQEDLKEAEEILKEKAAKEVEDALRDKIPPEFIVLEKAVKTEILETFSLARAEAELEKFTYQVKASSTALVFKAEDLKNFVSTFLSSEIPTGKIIHQESLKINYSLENVTISQGKLILSLTLETKIYSDIGEVSLKRALERKSLAEAKIFLENQPQITKAQIRPWPFWVKKIPATSKKIKITLNLLD